MPAEDALSHRAALKSHLRPQWKERLARECVDRVKKDRALLLWQQRTSGNGLRTYASREALGSILAEELRRAGDCEQTGEENADVRGSAAGQAEPQQSKNSSPGGANVRIEQDYVVELPAEESGSGRDDSSAASDMLWEEPKGAAGMRQDPMGSLSDAEYEELMLEMERVLHEDMAEEAQRHGAEAVDALYAEMAIVTEYEETEAALRDSIETHEQMMLEGSTPAVVCPLCQKGRLFSSDHSIFCVNGDFRIDTQHDNINLEYLERRLRETSEEHSKNCLQVPGFVLQERFGIKALYLACQHCAAFQIVI